MIFILDFQSNILSSRTKRVKGRKRGKSIYIALHYTHEKIFKIYHHVSERRLFSGVFFNQLKLLAQFAKLIDTVYLLDSDFFDSFNL